MCHFWNKPHAKLCCGGDDLIYDSILDARPSNLPLSVDALLLSSNGSERDHHLCPRCSHRRTSHTSSCRKKGHRRKSRKPSSSSSQTRSASLPPVVQQHYHHEDEHLEQCHLPSQQDCEQQVNCQEKEEDHEPEQSDKQGVRKARSQETRPQDKHDTTVLGSLEDPSESSLPSSDTMLRRRNNNRKEDFGDFEEDHQDFSEEPLRTGSNLSISSLPSTSSPVEVYIARGALTDESDVETVDLFQNHHHQVSSNKQRPPSDVSLEERGRVSGGLRSLVSCLVPGISYDRKRKKSKSRHTSRPTSLMTNNNTTTTMSQRRHQRLPSISRGFSDDFHPDSPECSSASNSKTTSRLTSKNNRHNNHRGLSTSPDEFDSVNSVNSSASISCVHRTHERHHHCQETSHVYNVTCHERNIKNANLQNLYLTNKFTNNNNNLKSEEEDVAKNISLALNGGASIARVVKNSVQGNHIQKRGIKNQSHYKNHHNKDSFNNNNNNSLSDRTVSASSFGLDCQTPSLIPSPNCPARQEAAETTIESQHHQNDKKSQQNQRKVDITKTTSSSYPTSERALHTRPASAMSSFKDVTNTIWPDLTLMNGQPPVLLEVELEVACSASSSYHGPASLSRTSLLLTPISKDPRVLSSLMNWESSQDSKEAIQGRVSGFSNSYSPMTTAGGMRSSSCHHHHRQRHHKRRHHKRVMDTPDRLLDHHHHRSRHGSCPPTDAVADAVQSSSSRATRLDDDLRKKEGQKVSTSCSALQMPVSPGNFSSLNKKKGKAPRPPAFSTGDYPDDDPLKEDHILRKKKKAPSSPVKTITKVNDESNCRLPVCTSLAIECNPGYNSCGRKRKSVKTRPAPSSPPVVSSNINKTKVLTRSLSEQRQLNVKNLLNAAPSFRSQVDINAVLTNKQLPQESDSDDDCDSLIIDFEEDDLKSRRRPNLEEFCPLLPTSTSLTRGVFIPGDVSDKDIPCSKDLVFFDERGWLHDIPIEIPSKLE